MGGMMKIVISAQGNDLESMVDPRFGRAAYFILYDTEEGKHEVIDNRQNAAAGQGAGVVTAQTVLKYKPDLIISGNLGPKAFQVLSAAGVKTALWSEGSVSEAIELAKNNQLKFADGANVAGHWM
jgi:predicted Fe-Mo cluster-binding NifX family protein